MSEKDLLSELELIAKNIDNLCQTQAISGIPCEIKCYWLDENNKKKSEKIKSSYLVSLITEGLYSKLNNIKYYMSKSDLDNKKEVIKRINHIKGLFL